MSAGVCGKRLGFEEFFGSPSPAPSAKRSRCSRYGSPVRSPDFGLGSDDKLSFLLRMFPSMDREVVESVLNSHNQKMDDAIRSLHALSLGDQSTMNETVTVNSGHTSDPHAVAGVDISCTSEPKGVEINHGSSDLGSQMPQTNPSWVDIFVQEMMNASDWNDVRSRAMKLLEAFEKSVITTTAESDRNVMEQQQQEVASLREQLECALRDNQILKKAVALQHERNLEHEEKLKEVEQLRLLIDQYQDQVRKLEVNNYTLRIHLQRAQDSSSMPSHFHPDIF